MEFITLNLLSTEPLYIQLRNSIRQAITSKRLKHMDRLPTEAEMRSIFSISTTVVRRAYDALVNQGLVIRIKGSGTFVNQRPRIRLALPLFEGALQDIDGYHSQAFALDFLKEKANVNPNVNLLVPPGQSYWIIKRLISYKDYPAIYQIIYLPEQRFKKLSLDLTAPFSLLDLCKNRYHHAIGKLKSRYLTKKADEAESFILQLDSASPLHFVISTLSDAQEKPLAYIQSFMDGKTVSLHTTPVYETRWRGPL